LVPELQALSVAAQMPAAASGRRNDFRSMKESIGVKGKPGRKVEK
jgi:hypothetical protein